MRAAMYTYSRPLFNSGFHLHDQEKVRGCDQQALSQTLEEWLGERPRVAYAWPCYAGAPAYLTRPYTCARTAPLSGLFMAAEGWTTHVLRITHRLHVKARLRFCLSAEPSLTLSAHC